MFPSLLLPLNWATNTDEGLGSAAEALFEKAREGPEALLDFLRWGERDAVPWRMTLLVAELGATLRTNHEGGGGARRSLSYR